MLSASYKVPTNVICIILPQLQEEPKSILTVSPPDIEEPASSSHVDSSQPSNGDLSMAVTSPGGGGELSVILEGRVEEVILTYLYLTFYKKPLSFCLEVSQG